MEKKKLKEIDEALKNPAKGRNSMGCPESMYNPNYLVGSCFTKKELEKMSKKELGNLNKLAEYASDVFY